MMRVNQPCIFIMEDRLSFLKRDTVLFLISFVFFSVPGNLNLLHGHKYNYNSIIFQQEVVCFLLFKLPDVYLCSFFNHLADKNHSPSVAHKPPIHKDSTANSLSQCLCNSNFILLYSVQQHNRTIIWLRLQLR